MSDRVKSLLIYAAKCVTGTICVFSISSLMGYKDFGWALISVMLVLSADGKDSVPLAITRIKANLVGGAVGVAFLFFFMTNVWILSGAIAITLTLCYLFKLDAGIRSALAATIIIMLHEEGRHHWDTGVERMIAVLGGCVLGLVITYVFHFREKTVISPQQGHQQES